MCATWNAVPECVVADSSAAALHFPPRSSCTASYRPAVHVHVQVHTPFSLPRAQSYSNHDIVRLLERIGAEFGACQNAYTTADETVYTLTVPTVRVGEGREGVVQHTVYHTGRCLVTRRVRSHSHGGRRGGGRGLGCVACITQADACAVPLLNRAHDGGWEGWSSCTHTVRSWCSGRVHGHMHVRRGYAWQEGCAWRTVAAWLRFRLGRARGVGRFGVHLDDRLPALVAVRR